MKYPCLVPKRLCKTDIVLVMEQEGRDKYGEPLPCFEYSGKCNYQDKAKTIFTADKKMVQITGSALFPGDICPELPVISGGTCIEQINCDKSISTGIAHIMKYPDEKKENAV